MTPQKNFHFKAATGFGAVIDGSVLGDSSEQVSRDLLRQGLIPVRIWADEMDARVSILSAVRKIWQGWPTKHGASEQEVA